MLEMLVEHFRTIKDNKAVEYWTKRHEFSQRVPEFVSLQYSKDSLAKLEQFASREKVETLLATKTAESSELLALYCWSHPHNDLEDRAYVELGTRRANKLLRGLFENAQSSCTIRGAAAQLARIKSADLFEPLVRRLPSDRREPGMNMDIANALDILGDARAVSALITVLAPKSNSQQDLRERVFQDIDGARCRAAIALGRFDTAESKKALQVGLHSPAIRGACAGALYRLTGEKEYLATLEQALTKDQYRGWVVLKRLTEKLPKDKALQTMLMKLIQQLKKDRKRNRSVK